MSKFQQLIWECEIFRDPRCDFSFLEDMEQRKLEGEKSRAMRKYEELKFSKDEILLVEQERQMNFLNLRILQKADAKKEFGSVAIKRKSVVNHQPTLGKKDLAI